MRLVAIFLLFASVLPVSGQKQGICGKVLWVEGNQMPGPGKKISSGEGVAREILVYEAVTMANTVSDNGFFTEVRSRLVATGKSKANGSYRINLPPGKYSVFTKESDGLFANLFDNDGFINAVTVTDGKFTDVNLTINYKAAY